ncbi:HAMP domain-containing sensor histidine kinase [Actinomycetospora corticicola]|uniref:Signal transduction histidine-protein kinase/phosphatase MprB n=1 Tax=Actinomycetospora corticicola TaxID=663602 RepID=A0A7Y9DTA0_9PSEU|nr:HAMP domain-containing sensor histidine kinase [Actinomycetospora corticicola]NYD35088.1 signal transduction histidine kinase [Actinomycetospora corticicola]
MRARIVRFAVIVSMVAITVFGLPLAVGAARYYVVDEQTDLEGDAQVAADAIGPVLAAGQVPTAVSPISAESPGAVYALDGRRVTGDGPDRLDASLTGALTGRVERRSSAGTFLVAVPVLDGDRRVGVLRAERSQGEAVERTAVTWVVMLVLGVAAVAGTRLVARRLATRLAAPLEVLADDARRLGEGDFTVSADAADAAVPEVAAVQRSLSLTATRLADLLARERAFSAEASHQLRTPLAGLRLRLEEAATLPPGSPGVAEAIEGSLESADRLDRTVTELLALAREPAGERRSRVDVVALSRRVVEEVGADGMAVDLVLPDDGACISGSEAAVRQVLTVLLENARVHGEAPVTVTVRDAGPAVALDVADSGALTVDESALFATRSPTEGHGIGLALARRLAEDQGGRLRLRSAAPTTITLLLPAASD